jgi:hypothetical protein
LRISSPNDRCFAELAGIKFDAFIALNDAGFYLQAALFVFVMRVSSRGLENVREEENRRLPCAGNLHSEGPLWRHRKISLSG